MSRLSVENLSVSRGSAAILKHVSFSVSKGETVALVGESGCGKSTTALSIMGLLKGSHVREGRILIGDTPLCFSSKEGSHYRRGLDVGMIFQQSITALSPIMTIGNQVKEGLLIHGLFRSSAATLMAEVMLERVGLSPARNFFGRYPYELSGGQCQRVCIAIALILEPKFLLADEPVTALDPLARANIVQVLKEHVRRGMGLLLITHDLSMALRVSDRVLVMQEGRIVEHCTAESIARKRAIHPHTRSLFKAAGHLPKKKPLHPLKQSVVLDVRDLVCDNMELASSMRLSSEFYKEAQVNFTIKRGEIVGLIGESGCGKSTLVQTILGLKQPKQGRILLGGKPIAENYRQIQPVFQDPYTSFNPSHKVSRIISEPLHLLRDYYLPSRPVRMGLVHRMLELVGLAASDAEKYADAFSGGQRQRIGIARAMIIQPSLIVLDESLSALDMITQARILDLLTFLSEERSVSFLLVSHDLGMVAAIADRLLVMRDGVIVEQGQAEDLLLYPKHSYTQSLVAAALALEVDDTFSSFLPF